MTDRAADARFMARAVHLARRGWRTTTPNPRVGCVLVRGGRIIGEGWHERAGGPHAEVAALADAAARGESTGGATAYVTLEPCCVTGRTPPCTAALREAGIARVVVGATDPNPRVDGGGLAELEQAGLSLQSGVLEAECAALNPGFFLRMTQGRPRFRVKIAMSLDGRTASANQESQWITGAAARRDVHALRAESCAVLTGSGTLLADDPQLNAREVDALRQPLRVLLDSQLKASPQARLFEAGPAVTVFTRETRDSAAAERRQALEARGARVIALPGQQDQGLDLQAVARVLGDMECNEVLVEAGSRLAGAFVAAGLADELIVYMAPQLLGDGGRAMLTLPSLETLADRVWLDIQDIRAVGEDWRIIARPRPAAV